MPVKNPFRNLKNSLYFISAKKVFSNYKISLDIFFLDLVFYILFYYTSQYATLLSKSVQSQIVILIVPLVFGIFTLMLYSFFKLNILRLLQKQINGEITEDKSDEKKKSGLLEIFEFKNFDAKRYFMFCLLNLMLIIWSILIMLVINQSLISFISEDYLPYVNPVINIPLILLFYVAFNIAQSMFFIEGKIKKVFGRELFPLIKKGIHAILITLIFLIIYSLILFGVSKLVGDTTTNKTVLITILTITNIVYYILHFINRIYLLSVVGKTREIAVRKDVLPQHKSGSP